MPLAGTAAAQPRGPPEQLVPVPPATLCSLPAGNRGGESGAVSPSRTRTSPRYRQQPDMPEPAPLGGDRKAAEKKRVEKVGAKGSAAGPPGGCVGKPFPVPERPPSPQVATEAQSVSPASPGGTVCPWSRDRRSCALHSPRISDTGMAMRLLSLLPDPPLLPPPPPPLHPAEICCWRRCTDRAFPSLISRIL